MEKIEKKSVKKKRRINWQKIFCFMSLIFILVCIFWYGGRFIYFYKESEKTLTEESNMFARVVKTQNHDSETFKQVGQDYYFYGNVLNNYVSYSNRLWRIIKVNKDNSIVLVTDNVIGTLAYGNSDTDYQNSNLFSWLNVNEEEPNSGVFERTLNEKEKYLVKNSTCIDNVDDVENVTCEKVYDDGYLGLLSVWDYIYTGSNKGFIHNERYSYLSNQNENKEIWYVNDEGKLDISSGEDILGIKATITLSPTLELKNGTGTSDDPYYFEDSNGLIGSYVKLDSDIWRIYEEKNGIVKLILESIIVSEDETDSSNKFQHRYSKSSYYHNDTIYGSLAYYLNRDFYNSLGYNSLILENTYVNGFYGNDNDYLYDDINQKTIETKVAIPSINDVLWNDTLDNYFTDTGISENSSLVYVRKEKGLVTSKNVTAESYVVPCISISKDNLKVGSGSFEDPYRTE